MPTRAAISAAGENAVIVTFWMFGVVFTMLLAAEVCIMLNQIKKGSKLDYESLKD